MFVFSRLTLLNDKRSSGVNSRNQYKGRYDTIRYDRLTWTWLVFGNRVNLS